MILDNSNTHSRYQAEDNIHDHACEAWSSDILHALEALVNVIAPMTDHGLSANDSLDAVIHIGQWIAQNSNILFYTSGHKLFPSRGLPLVIADARVMVGDARVVWSLRLSSRSRRSTWVESIDGATWSVEPHAQWLDDAYDIPTETLGEFVRAVLATGLDAACVAWASRVFFAPRTAPLAALPTVTTRATLLSVATDRSEVASSGDEAMHSP